MYASQLEKISNLLNCAKPLQFYARCFFLNSYYRYQNYLNVCLVISMLV